MRSKRTAFTLVELLVVISIIGMLMAILLPAIGAATESARATQCRNRTKQITLAMLGYESRNQAFPGYTDGKEEEGEPIQMSWLVALMPDLERQDIFDNYNPANFEELSDTYLDFLVCPSNPPLKKNAVTSYVANAGYDKRDAAGCGVFHTAWPLRDARTRKKTIHQRTTLDKISAGDGASMTLVMSENLQATSWMETAFFNRSASAADIPAVKNGTPHNVFVYTNRSNPNDAYKINSKEDERGRPWPPNAPSTEVNARPSSEHRGGVTVGFADGHAEFLRDSIDYTVYARLMSPEGKKCNKNQDGSGIDHSIVLSDTDYK